MPEFEDKSVKVPQCNLAARSVSSFGRGFQAFPFAVSLQCKQKPWSQNFDGSELVGCRKVGERPWVRRRIVTCFSGSNRVATHAWSSWSLMLLARRSASGDGGRVQCIQ
jgi:hypothetical protein